MMKKEPKVTILVGDGLELLDFYGGMNDAQRVVGVFCGLAVTLPSGLTRLGDVADVPAYLDGHPNVGRIFCSTSRIEAGSVRSIQSACKMRAVSFHAVLPVVNELETKLVPKVVDGKMTLATRREPLSRLHNRIVKRVVDLLLTIVFMLTVFPFLYFCKAVKIKRAKRGPSFRFDTCCGPNGKVFRRVSFVGEERSLARLFNVLAGKMSLVGPACYVVDSEQGTAALPKRLERREVKSGMTGWAQIQKKTEAERVAADIWYVENWSLWLDLRILLRSIF